MLIVRNREIVAYKRCCGIMSWKNRSLDRVSSTSQTYIWCSRRLTAITSIHPHQRGKMSARFIRCGMPRMCQTSQRSEPTVAQPVARGFTVECILNQGITERPHAFLVAIHRYNGALLGLLTDVFSIIAPRLTPRGVPGQNARSTSGGTRKRSSGQAMTSQIFL